MISKIEFRHGSKTCELENKPCVWLDYVGDWAVICADCAKTHKTVIVALTEVKG